MQPCAELIAQVAIAGKVGFGMRGAEALFARPETAIEQLLCVSLGLLAHECEMRIEENPSFEQKLDIEANLFKPLLKDPRPAFVAQLSRNQDVVQLIPID